jgi:hypothetical protein
MVLGLVMLGDANLARVVADPPLLWKVIAPDEPEAYERARRESSKGGFLAKLFGRRQPAEEPEPFEMGETEGITTDLDKAWHGIDYLLGERLPFLVDGGRSVTGVEPGYGPPRVFTADETRAIRDELSRVSDDELRARFDPEAMDAAEIYPNIWVRDGDEGLAYLLENVQTLRGFLDQAVDEGLGIIVYLT